MINYVKGDATLPQGQGGKLIIHACNNRSGWGKGFTGAINARWPERMHGINKVECGRSVPEFIYRQSENKLGDVQFCPVSTADGSNLWVANMVCQDGYKSEENPVPLNYTYLGRCLDEVENFLTGMKKLGISLQVSCPKIGAGLAGGNWDLIEKRLQVHISQDVTVYEI